MESELRDATKHAETVRRDLTTERQRLTDQRKKLLDAHYAGAVPLDLLKQEQDRITALIEGIDGRLEAETGDFEKVLANLDRAVALIRDCHGAYLAAGPQVRREYNQALFQRIYVDGDEVRVDIAEPFRTVAGVEVMSAVGRGAERTTFDGTEGFADGLGASATSRGWSAEYISLIRGRRRRSGSRSPVTCGAGLSKTVLVPLNYFG